MSDDYSDDKVRLLKVSDKSPNGIAIPIPSASINYNSFNRSSQRDTTKKLRDSSSGSYRINNTFNEKRPRKPNISANGDDDFEIISVFQKGQQAVKKYSTGKSLSSGKARNPSENIKSQSDQILLDTDEEDVIPFSGQQKSNRVIPKKLNKSIATLEFTESRDVFRDATLSPDDDSDNNDKDQHSKASAKKQPSGRTTSRGESSRVIDFRHFPKDITSPTNHSRQNNSNTLAKKILLKPLNYSSTTKYSISPSSLKRKNHSEDDDFHRNSSVNRSPNGGGNTFTCRLKSLQVGKTMINADSEKTMDVIFENKHIRIMKNDDIILDLPKDKCKHISFSNISNKPKAMLITPKLGWCPSHYKLDFNSDSAEKANQSILLLVDNDSNDVFGKMLSGIATFWNPTPLNDMEWWMGIMKSYANHSGPENLDNMVEPSNSSILDHQMKTRSATAQGFPHNTQLFVYPFNGAGAVTIMKDDVERLEDGEFLNDNIIEFYLKWSIDKLKGLNPKLAETVHLFNSFFYKRYTGADKKKRYDLVKKWTAKINLFEKKYIFVPVNEHMHWYLVLVSNPQHLMQETENRPEIKIKPSNKRSQARNPKRHDRPPASSSDDDKPILVKDDEDEFSQSSQSASVELMDTDGQPKEDMVTENSPGNRMECMKREIINLDSQPSQKIIIEIDSTPQSNTFERHPSSVEMLESWPSKNIDANAETRIIVFDSLGTKHPPTFGNIRRYLESEALEKQNWTINQTAIKSHHAMVPIQPNHCDCGIYMLHYVEKFLSDPDKYLDIVINKKNDEQAWSPGEIHQKRQLIKELIENTTKEYDKFINSGA